MTSRLLALLFVLLASAPSVPAQRVLLVDLDDVGFDLIARTETPTLDRLSAEGRSFLRFFTNPICSPTRARLHTGAYGSHADQLCGGIVFPDGRFELPLQPLVPLGRLASDHGFTTAKLGKWHLCPDTRPTHPNEAGWGYYAGNLENLRWSQGESYFGFRKVINGQWGWRTAYLASDETDDGIACVQAGFDLISVSYHSVHVPYHVPPDDLHSVDQPSTDEEKARAMLEALDHELGRLLDAAIDGGYTVLVFADNGTDDDVGGEKGHVTPGGVNVPLWALGPGIVPGVDHGFVDVVDLYATVADLLGIVRTAPSLQGPDSISFAARLAGSTAPTRSMVFSERWTPNGRDPHDGLPDGSKWRRSLRADGWSLIVDDKLNEGLHFYEYQVDLREEHDLLAKPLTGTAKAALQALRTLLAGF